MLQRKITHRFVVQKGPRVTAVGDEGELHTGLGLQRLQQHTQIIITDQVHVRGADSLVLAVCKSAAWSQRHYSGERSNVGLYGPILTYPHLT